MRRWSSPLPANTPVRRETETPAASASHSVVGAAAQRGVTRASTVRRPGGGLLARPSPNNAGLPRAALGGCAPQLALGYFRTPATRAHHAHEEEVEVKVKTPCCGRVSRPNHLSDRRSPRLDQSTTVTYVCHNGDLTVVAVGRSEIGPTTEAGRRSAGREGEAPAEPVSRQDAAQQELRPPERGFEK